MNETPFEIIKKSLSLIITSDLVDLVPDKWEKIGDILVLKINPKLETYKNIISEKYASILGCKAVLQDMGGISGSYRVPNVKLIFGSKNTITTHNENGIRFKLDPTKIMFSSGNVDERIRMAEISNENETVIDFFAGIGYFSIPMAFHSKSKIIYACEINPVAYGFLCENIVLNNVTENVQPLEGDNRIVAPFNVADRVIMGNFGKTHIYLPTAFKCLKKSGGFIHYHDLLPDRSIPNQPLKIIEKEGKKEYLKTRLINLKKIKSYAPGITHFVLDIKVV
jgi:tRNA wybutosine-synthesizing protein 2